jgi:hypothetical protein
MKTLSIKKSFFATRAERPKEAPAIVLQKKIFCGKVEMDSWISYKLSISS